MTEKGSRKLIHDSTGYMKTNSLQIMVHEKQFMKEQGT